LNYSQRMKTFRTILGTFAILPLALLTYRLLLHPADYGEDSLITFAFLVVGVPILTLNFWAWQYPEIIEFYFPGFKDKDLNLKVIQDVDVSSEIGLQAQ
jgi:hypothetical protein